MKAWKRARLLLALLACIWALASLRAQAPTGEILGQVIDPVGEVMPGVTVTIRGASLAQARVVVTNSSGRFRAATLPDGSYDLTVTLAGFKPASRTSVLVSRGQPTDLAAIALDLGSEREPDLQKLGLRPGETVVAVRTSGGDFTLAVDKTGAPAIAKDFLSRVDAHFYDGGAIVPLFAPSQPGDRAIVTGLELTMRPDHQPDSFRAVVSTSELAREGERREIFGRVWNWPGTTGAIPDIVGRFVNGPQPESPLVILHASQTIFLESFPLAAIGPGPRLQASKPQASKPPSLF